MANFLLSITTKEGQADLNLSNTFRSRTYYITFAKCIKGLLVCANFIPIRNSKFILNYLSTLL